jgi:MSHA biogenesis protein MshQ
MAHGCQYVHNFNNIGIKIMKVTKQYLLISIFSVVCGAQADDMPLLNPDLNAQTVYAGAALTTGAGAYVGGSLQAIQAATLGAHSEIEGNLATGGPITLGASTKVSRNVEDETALVTAGTALTLGDHALVEGDLLTGTGPITLGGMAIVGGTATHAISITISATASVTHTQPGSPALYERSNPPGSQQKELMEAQIALKLMNVDYELAPTLIVDTTFGPGVYHATGLTTTAGIIITLEGNTDDESGDTVPSLWVFNIDSYLSFGAGTTIVLDNVHPESTIIWNTGTYISTGAGAIVRGTFIAGTYVTTGAGTILAGISGDGACDAIFATNEAVTLGAGTDLSNNGCTTEFGAVNTIFFDENGLVYFNSDTISGEVEYELDGHDGAD